MEEGIENQAGSNEEGYAQELRQERARDEPPEESATEMPSEEREELEALAGNKNKTAMFLISFLLKTLSDAADWLGIPSIPVIGDMLDIATGGISIFSYLSIAGTAKTKAVKKSIAAFVFELLPLGINDLIPTYMIEGIWSYFTTQKITREAEEKLGKNA